MITLEKIKERLSYLGYTAVAADDGMITFIQNTVENSVKLTLNVIEIPEDVENIIIDKICGEFLVNKKSTGQNIGIDVDQAVTSIQEGDTNVSFDKALTGEAQLSMLLKWLISGRDGVLLRHRCIRW